jgi:EpsI family protein
MKAFLSGRLSSRIFLAAAVLGAVQLAMIWSGSMGMPTKTSVPRRDFRELPMQLGSWRGEKIKVESRLATADHARASVYRLYTNPAGARVTLYAAVFSDVDVQITPHSPETCYPAAGHHITKTQEVRIPLPDGSALLTRLLNTELDQEAQQILFWYQVPGSTYVDCYGQRKAFSAYRGKPARPAVVKIVLQTAGPETELATDSLKNLAPLLYGWVKSYQEAR